MKRKMMKGTALTGLLGVVLMATGCWQQILYATLISVGTEFLIDNNGLFDLFNDGIGVVV